MKLGVFMLWTEMRGTDLNVGTPVAPAAELRATPLRASSSVGSQVLSAAATKKALAMRVPARKRWGLVEATR